MESAERIGRIARCRATWCRAWRASARTSPSPASIKQIGTFARLEFAESDGKASARTAAFHAACKQAGIEAAISANIQREIWMKFAMLAPLAGMTALTRGPIGCVRQRAVLALLQAAVEETVAVGMALKAGLEPADAAKIIKLVDGLPNAMMASMAHDLLAGKPIELDGLSGAVARLAQAHGVAAPTHAFVAQALAPFTDGPPKA